MKPSRRATTPGLIVALALPLAALVAPAHADDDDGRQWRSGQVLYEKVCGHCHRPEVGVGTLLEGRELPPEYLKVIVRNGLGAMPAFPESFVDDASLAELARYLGTLPVPVPASTSGDTREDATEGATEDTTDGATEGKTEDETP